MQFSFLLAVICNYILISSCVLIDDSIEYGRVFEGIGGLSGGGATSKLLVNYPQQQRDEILDYLFKPNFGASLQILKVEIGGDAQSTDGGESSHMHESWDEDYHRGYEWWLMAEAKKRNPRIKLAALPWAFPGWLGFGTSSPFTKPAVLADYVVRWLVAARDVHNLTIDYIGIWNEKPYNVVYVKTLREVLNQRKLNNVQIIVADGGWDVTSDVISDKAFANAVDIIGVHYPGTLSTDDAKKCGKRLWASEDYSTFNDNVGAGCWARIINQNYVAGLMTSTIAWNLIASYYNTLPFGRDGLMTAVEPWTGHYDVMNPIWVTAHTTQFTEVGWRYLGHGHGVGLLDHGGSYVSLTDPQAKHLTMVIEKMSHDRSICIRPPLPPYNTAAENETFTLADSLSHIKQLNMWYSRLGFGGQVFIKLAPIEVVHGQFTLYIEPDTIITLTTLAGGIKGQYPTPPPSAPFPLPYHDSFDGYQVPSEANNLASQIGMFETVNAHSSVVLRQKVLTRPVAWCGLPIIDVMTVPVAYIGDFSWSDVNVTVDILVPSVNASDGAFVAARIDRGGCGTFAAKGVFLWLYPRQQRYMVTGDLAGTSLLSSGPVSLSTDVWYRLSLFVRGSVATGAVNGKEIVRTDVSSCPGNGFVGLGTPNFGYADFDNLDIARSYI